MLAWLILVVTVSGCFRGEPEPEPVGGPDIFELVVTEAPGGALLSVWVPPVGAEAWIAGGYVAVPASEVPEGMGGRLLHYEEGRFETVCRTPATLWWVTGLAGTVIAAGEDGTVLVHSPERPCEVVDIGGDWPAGRPTFWGIRVDALDDVRFVGGHASPGGPKGVVLHWDGATFTPEDVPVEARTQNIYKIDRIEDRLIAVGSGGLVIHRSDCCEIWTPAHVPALGSDDYLFTVSCARSGSLCVAVGGISGARVLLGVRTNWSQSMPPDPYLPGLNGVWVENDQSIFMVGQLGATLHYNGFGYYAPLEPLTGDTFHAVHGNPRLVMAVGGEIGLATSDQRASILLRGGTHDRYTVDGVEHLASGELRTRLGSGRGQ